MLALTAKQMRDKIARREIRSVEAVAVFTRSIGPKRRSGRT